MQKTWLNGELCETLPTTQLDRGLQFGDGHFTTLRLSQSKPLWWSYHYQRLQHASARLNLPIPAESSLLQCVAKAATHAPDAIVKIIITSGASGRGYARSPDQSNWYLTLSELPPQAINAQVIQQQLQLGLAKLQLACQPLLAGLKTLNRLEQVLLADELSAQRDSGTTLHLDDLIVCDTRNYLCESTRGNLFWYDGNQWHTPSLTQAGVAGVARQVILNQHWLGKVAQGDYPLAAILSAQQAFMCNSVFGAQAIAKINGVALSDATLPKGVNGLIQ
ncbi:MAG: aminodeoxychorismate lyase [Idiomarina sp.]